MSKIHYFNQGWEAGVGARGAEWFGWSHFIFFFRSRRGSQSTLKIGMEPELELKLA